MTTQDTGVFNADGGAFDTDSGADAILNRWLDAGSLSVDDDGGAKLPKAKETAIEEDDENEEETEETQDVEDSDEDTSDQETDEDSQDDDDESEETEEDATPTKAGDEALVELIVDGEARTVSVKELKRLYGQEASLTRKSQEVAQERKKAEETGAKHAAALQTLMARAQSRVEPFQNIDWMVAQAQLDPEEFAGLRSQAKEAFDEVAYLQTEVDQFVQATQSQRASQIQEAAKEAIADITNPQSPNHIKGWSKEVYDDIRAYAVREGLAEEEVNQVVHPAVIKLLHKAYQYDKASKSVVTKKKATSAKRVLKSDTKAEATNSKKPALDEAKRFRQTGSVDDGVELMLARWKAAQGED